MRHINQNLQNILFLAVAILFGFSNSYAQDSSALHYVPINENEAYVTYITHPQSNNYTPYSGNIVIPSVVSLNNKAYTITGIGDWAFYDCRSLTEITIPNGITVLNNYVLADCTGLTTVNLPSTMTTVCGYAMKGCTGLKSLSLPSSITKKVPLMPAPMIKISYMGGFSFRGFLFGGGLRSVMSRMGFDYSALRQKYYLILNYCEDRRSIESDTHIRC